MSRPVAYILILSLATRHGASRLSPVGLSWSKNLWLDYSTALKWLVVYSPDAESPKSAVLQQNDTTAIAAWAFGGILGLYTSELWLKF